MDKKQMFGINRKLKNTPEISSRIPIFLASDENYAPFVATTIASACYSQKKFGRTNVVLDFYVLDGGMFDFTKRQIESLRDKFDNFTIEFLPVDIKNEFEKLGIKHVGHISMSGFSRILAPRLKPNIKRGIYMDVDVLVLDDLEPLLNMDMGGYPIAAMVACPISDNAKRNGTRDPLAIQMGVPPETMRYFNSGVMLIDFKKWLDFDTEKKFIDVATSGMTFQTGDQCMLNVVFYQNLCEFPQKYNVTQYLLENFPPESKDIVIRHFSARSKPWNTMMDEGFNDFWFFAEMTPFFNGLKLKYITQTTKK